MRRNEVQEHSQTHGIVSTTTDPHKFKHHVSWRSTARAPKTGGLNIGPTLEIGSVDSLLLASFDWAFHDVELFDHAYRRLAHPDANFRISGTSFICGTTQFAADQFQSFLSTPPSLLSTFILYLAVFSFLPFLWTSWVL